MAALDLSDDEQMSLALETTEDYHQSHEATYELPLSEQEQFEKSLHNLSLADDADTRAAKVEQLVNQSQGTGNLVKQLGWLFGSLLVLVVVLGSIFWFKRFELAADPSWRPYIDKVCQLIPCGLPEQRDVSKIELRSREVTIGENAVTINMILLNRASFVQPYPRIEIEFFDLDNNSVATRVKLPTEYLRSDLRKTPMPVAIPVHIEFDVSVDTEEVVGYVFRFL
jgi:hypothetical protein